MVLWANEYFFYFNTVLTVFFNFAFRLKSGGFIGAR